MKVRTLIRAGEQANFLEAPAPDLFQAAQAPDFFPQLLQLRLLSIG